MAVLEICGQVRLDGLRTCQDHFSALCPCVEQRRTHSHCAFGGAYPAHNLAVTAAVIPVICCYFNVNLYIRASPEGNKRRVY